MNQCTTDCVKKYSDVYKTTYDITNLKIRIKIKEVVTGNRFKNGLEESKVFRWQEKVHSKSERQFYKGCPKSNIESEEINKENEDIETNYTGVFFTYVSDDNISDENPVKNSERKSKLVQKIDQFKPENVCSDNTKKYDFLSSLQDAISNPFVRNNFEKYYIMADFGSYIDNLWIKNEFILCTIKYDKNNQILIVDPDFSESDPYLLEYEDNEQHQFHYYIEDESEIVNKEEEDYYQKIIEHRCLFREKVLYSTFNLPPLSKIRTYIFLEILTARNFEYNDIFVEYIVDLPKGWTSTGEDALNQRTQTSHCYATDKTSFFGMPFEMSFDYNLKEFRKFGFMQAPCIYFEIVSKDGWNRYRNEGLTYLMLPVLQPGNYTRQLNCLRMVGASPMSNLRRFFIGDYRNYKNIDWINKPNDYEDIILNKYGSYTVSSSKLEIRFSVVIQSEAFLNELGFFNTTNIVLEKLKCSALIKTVEQVLEGFRRAKRKMVETRRKCAM